MGTTGRNTVRSKAIRMHARQLCQVTAPCAGAHRVPEFFFRWNHLQRKDRCCGVTLPFRVRDGTNSSHYLRCADLRHGPKGACPHILLWPPCCSFTSARVEYTLWSEKTAGL